MTNIYTIYKHVNIHNNKVYIGITGNTMNYRWNQHLGESLRNPVYKFHKAIAKYGESSFEHILLNCTNDLDKAKNLEKYYISLYDSYKNGYNSTPGGDGTYERDDVWKYNRSLHMKSLYENDKITSPFLNPEVHKKTITQRTLNGTNVFETNNPMLNDSTKQRKLDSMPNMKGRKQWINVITGELKQQINHPEPTEEWIAQGFTKGKSNKSKGTPKPKVECVICGRLLTAQTLPRHNKTNHESC